MDIQKIQERLKDYQEHEKQLLTAGPSTATMIELSQQIIQENYLDDVTNLLSIISQLTAEIKRIQWACSNAYDDLNQQQSKETEKAKEFLYKALTESVTPQEDNVGMRAEIERLTVDLAESQRLLKNELSHAVVMAKENERLMQDLIIAKSGVEGSKPNTTIQGSR